MRSLKPLRRLPADTALSPAAAPIELAGPPERPAFLLVHGFTGGPFDLAWLAEGLHRAGHAVSVPRLPGHGSTPADLMASDARDWLRAAVDAYLTLSLRHADIVLVGHSMGGLLAAALAARFPVARLALLAPAFDLRWKGLSLARFVAPFVASVRLPARPEAGPVRQSGGPELERLLANYKHTVWVGPSAELRRLQKLGRASLARIECPVCTVLAGRDATVAERAALRVARGVRSAELRHVVLADSGHVLTDGPQREAVLEILLAEAQAASAAAPRG